ncbi:MAG: prepilin-type N-terminal cleavage/methylation domain-containing protein [Nodosilinea sp. LVE1205-7]
MGWSQQLRQSQGFTLIELLVVILVMGILATMLWPMMFHQIAKARQAKALNAVGAMTRAQHDFFYERGKFSGDITELGFAYLNHEDKSYSYGVEAADRQNKRIKIKAQPITQDPLRGYTGVIYVNQDSQGNAIISSLVCQGDKNRDAPDPEFKETSNGPIEVTGCASL